MAYKEHGQHQLERFIERLDEYAKLEQNIKSEGRTMHAIVSPLKSKKKKKQGYCYAKNEKQSRCS